MSNSEFYTIGKSRWIVNGRQEDVAPEYLFEYLLRVLKQRQSLTIVPQILKPDPELVAQKLPTEAFEGTILMCPIIRREPGTQYKCGHNCAMCMPCEKTFNNIDRWYDDNSEKLSGLRLMEVGEATDVQAKLRGRRYRFSRGGVITMLQANQPINGGVMMGAEIVNEHQSGGRILSEQNTSTRETNVRSVAKNKNKVNVADIIKYFQERGRLSRQNRGR